MLPLAADDVVARDTDFLAAVDRCLPERRGGPARVSTEQLRSVLERRRAVGELSPDDLAVLVALFVEQRQEAAKLSSASRAVAGGGESRTARAADVVEERFRAAWRRDNPGHTLPGDPLQALAEKMVKAANRREMAAVVKVIAAPIIRSALTALALRRGGSARGRSESHGQRRGVTMRRARPGARSSSDDPGGDEPSPPLRGVPIGQRLVALGVA